MGKYKKYAKIEQNSDQPNNISSNNINTNNSNQNNKIVNKRREITNKNELNNLKDRNYIKNDETPISKILWEIYDAMIYFFIMCKNFILPSGISFKIFVSFLILELLYQGIIIYIIKSVLYAINKYFSIWTGFTNMYIYIISYIQMIYIFISEGLLIFRFIHLKIYIFKKLNWLINILTFIIIILNAISMNEIYNKVYKFYGKNNNYLYLDNNNNIKENLVNEYINLYVNKNDDYEYYELCYEIKFNYFIFEKIKKKFPNYKWRFDRNSKYYVGCKNFSLSKNSFFDNSKKYNLYFNCQNKFDTNTAPNFCVSSKYRQKRFYSHLKMAIFEIMILILWNLYNYFSIELIYHYYPFLKNNSYEQNNCNKKKNNDYNDSYKYNNNNNYEKQSKIQTVTYKDINDKEINDYEYYEEEEEGEYEEDENVKKNDENKKSNNIKEYKVRKISKRKMKTYKKKRKKNRYKEEQIKNKNKYFDEEILDKDYFENNKNIDDDSSDNNVDDKDENFYKNDNDDIGNNDINEKTEDKEESEDLKEKEEEEEELATNYNYIESKNKFEEFWKKCMQKIRKHQHIERTFNFIFGNYIDLIKNKIHHILLDIDKNLSDDNDNDNDKNDDK